MACTKLQPYVDQFNEAFDEKVKTLEDQIKDLEAKKLQLVNELDQLTSTKEVRFKSFIEATNPIKVGHLIHSDDRLFKVHNIRYFFNNGELKNCTYWSEKYRLTDLTPYAGYPFSHGNYLYIEHDDVTATVVDI